MQRQRKYEDRPYIRKIEFAFYHEMQIREAVYEAREEIRQPEVFNGSGLPDPTLREVIRRLTPIEAVTICGDTLKYPERWLEVIDKTYAWCRRQSDIHYEIARRRYQGEDYRKTCRELAISEPLMYQIMEKIRTYAALQAAQLNLIFVE